jgi:glucan 1,3-beta-glucosidase
VVYEPEQFVSSSLLSQFFLALSRPDPSRSYRSVRNFIIDLTGAPAAGATALHWQVSQSTSLINIVVEMGAGSQHQGMFMENGSGGFMGDLVFNGGKIGMWLGNQQFTVRNVTVNGATTGIFADWNWGWTYQGQPEIA